MVDPLQNVTAKATLSIRLSSLLAHLWKGQYADRPLLFLQITDLETVRGFEYLTQAIPVGTVRAYVEVEGANVRWRSDGVDPTTTIGHLAYIGEALNFSGDELYTVLFLETAGGGIMNVTFYGIGPEFENIYGN